MPLILARVAVAGQRIVVERGRLALERARRIVEGCAGALGEEELKPLRARAADLENLGAPLQPSPATPLS